ncbi:Eukaryotic rRNA processing [Moelleriella libera RCEF 2490]|uniref:Eukaryotic rRNA processing n=1 Tax=Moelleriella libera RCEF 2490 TaxID=1081109 RepID=A0A162I873_9HYPO|nr:Eukaryotic rRNA processing [Moelleriella libera RCEF 2490]
MVIKSRLRLALAAEKGVDFSKLKQEKKQRQAMKRKSAMSKHHGSISTDSVEEDESERDCPEATHATEFPLRVNVGAIDETDTSDSELETEERNTGTRREKTMRPDRSKDGNNNVEVDEAEAEDEVVEEDDIPISDLEELDDEDKEDLVPHTRLTIENTSALIAALGRMNRHTDEFVTFASHQCVSSSTGTAESIPDISDDLQREIAFYSQCLGAAQEGRARLLAEGVPFSRPKDYFAEMVKEDAHMERVKAKLIEEASAKKASAEARKLRDLKKFGKQVQVAKLQERQKAKRETLDKIKTLKRNSATERQESGDNIATNEGDLFDVSIDNELAKYSKTRTHAGPGINQKTPGFKRQKKNERYGFGGKKKYGKSGDAISSGDLSGFTPKKMKTAAKVRTKTSRPGKSRRKAMTSKSK